MFFVCCVCVIFNDLSSTWSKSLLPLNNTVNFVLMILTSAAFIQETEIVCVVK